MPRLLYIHGFASSPHGRKVERLRRTLEPEGYVFDVPDLNVPSFRWLDFEAMVQLVLERSRQRPPDAIIGSSLGALVALTAASNGVHTPMILIAPAFAIAGRWLADLPDKDPATVFNYAVDRNAEIHRAFFEQMGRVDIDRAPPPVPVTLLMGRNDENVPFDCVEGRWREWQSSKGLAPGSKFVEIPDGDHGLVEHSEIIAEAIRQACE